jgi:chromosomal replication initiation ATPase DnaA
LNKTELIEAYIRARLDGMVKQKVKPVEPPPPPPKPEVIVLMPPVKKGINDVERILAAVAIAHKVTPAQIRGRTRDSRIVWARHHATWEIYSRREDLSLVTIAVVTNRRCHTSVINSIEMFKKGMKHFDEHINVVKRELAEK